MRDIIVIENAVDLEKQNTIKDLCMSAEFPWFYHATTVYKESAMDSLSFTEEFLENTLDTPLFAHVLWLNYGRNSGHADMFFPIVDAIPFKIVRLERLKINLTLPHTMGTTNTRSIAHTDLSFLKSGYYTAIYYVNDSDGDTFIYNERVGHTGKLTVKQRISPKQGRMVVFDGGLLHSGNNPINTKARLTVNINVLVDS